MTKELKPHDRTRRVMVGDVPVGGGAPVAVQSMLNAPADDVAANLAQIEALAEAGCEIVRMAIPRRDCLDAFEAVCSASPLPVVADIHFDARIAIEAAARGAAKLRINPGNIGGLEATREVIAAASAAGIPIRIGVNAGSLDDALAARDDLTSTTLWCQPRPTTCRPPSTHIACWPPSCPRCRCTSASPRREPPSKASSKAHAAWASFWKRASATPCASRSRTTPWWKCGPAGRCSAPWTCAVALPSSSAVPPAGAAR